MENRQSWGSQQFKPTGNPWSRPAAPPTTAVNAFRPFRTKPPRNERFETLKREAEERLAKNGFAGFQLVRREFMATRYDPSVTVRKDSLAFNNTCISRLEDAEYIQFMVDADAQQMLIRPCKPWVRGALRWCTAKRKKREIVCYELTRRLYGLMGWNQEYRYRIQGIEIEFRGEKLYLFDLKSREAFAPVYKDPTTGKRVVPKAELPKEWGDSFGMSVEESEASTRIFTEDDENGGKEARDE